MKLFYKLSAVEKPNTLMQTPELRQKSYSLLVVSLLPLQPLRNLFQSRRGGKSLMCPPVIYSSVSSPFLHPSLHPTLHPLILGCGSSGGCHLGSSDVEDEADAQEEAPEDCSQLGDQVKLHHFTQLGVVAGGMGLELVIGQP